MSHRHILYHLLWSTVEITVEKLVPSNKLDTCVVEDAAPTLLFTFLQDSNTASGGRSCGQKCGGVIFQDT